LEGSGHDLIGVLSQHLLGGTEKNYKKPVRIADVPAKIQTKHLQNTVFIFVLQKAQF
jgi:hypothetical protein